MIAALLGTLLSTPVGLAREPMPPTPLTQSQLVSAFMDHYQLPEELASELRRAAVLSASARLLGAPDLALRQRSELRSEGARASVSASLELPIVAPSLPLEAAIAEVGEALTMLDVADARMTATRAFLELLVRLQHAEDSTALVADALRVVRRTRPGWLATSERAEPVRLAELPAATDARLAEADLRALQRQVTGLRRAIAEHTGLGAATDRDILPDLPVLRVRASIPSAADSESIQACLGTAMSVRRSRTVARWNALQRDREAVDGSPVLSLRIAGTYDAAGEGPALAGSATLGLSMRVPSWSPITSAFSLDVGPDGAEQDLDVGWPNRQRDPPPAPRTEPDTDLSLAVRELERALQEHLASIQDLRDRLHALDELRLRTRPLMLATDQEDALMPIDAARQLAKVGLQLVDLEAALRLEQVDLALACGTGPFRWAPTHTADRVAMGAGGSAR